MENSTIVGCAIGVVVTIGAVVGLSIWLNRDSWNPDEGEAKIIELTDLYNDAIREFPGDVNKATFKFDVEAAKKREEFLAAKKQFEEHVKWLERYDEQVKVLKKAIRKP